MTNHPTDPTLPEIVAISTVDLEERRDAFAAMLRSLPPEIRLVVVVRGVIEVDAELRDMMPERVSIIRVSSASLSAARNLALEEVATWGLGDSAVIAFPDDDCTWSENTGPALHRLFSDPHLNLVIGRYRPRDEEFAPHFPSQPGELTPRVVLTRGASIVIFTSAHTALSLQFDEEMGVGARYPSGEDSNFALRALALHGSGRYEPEVICFHRYEHEPDPSRKIIAGFIMARHSRRFPSLLLPLAQWCLRWTFRGPDRARAIKLTAKGFLSQWS